MGEEAGSPRRRWGWTAALVVSTGILVWGATTLDAAAVAAVLLGTDPRWLLPALLLNLSTVVLWAALWHLLLPGRATLPFSRVLGVTSVMAMVANTVPLMVGHATGTVLLAREDGVGEGAALSVLAQDQLLEGLAKLMLLAAVAWVAPLPEPLRRGGAAVALGVLLLLVVLVLLSTWEARTRSHGAAAQGGAVRRSGEAPRGPAALLVFLRTAAGELMVFRRPAVFGGGVVLAGSMKVAEALAILCAARAVGLELPAWTVLPVLGAVSVAGMVPVAPGNLGVYEGAAFWAWRWMGVDPGTAAAVALLQHLVYLLPVVGAGWVVMGRRAWESPAASSSAARRAAP